MHPMCSAPHVLAGVAVRLPRTGQAWLCWIALVTAIALAGCGGGEEMPRSVEQSKSPLASSKLQADGATSETPTLSAAPIQATQATQVPSVSATELFDWAEGAYPAYFPSHQKDQTLSPYIYRHYPETGNYLGLNGQTIVVLGPISGGAILEVGTLSGFACSVRPALCNTAPVANAGAPQSVLTGASVKLDGSHSTDADQNTLTFAWRLASKPAGSAAVLSDTKAVQPAFVADKPGQYIFELVVSDTLVSSAPATVVITVADANVAPVANAGGNQSVLVGAVVLLSGAASKDANGDALTFQWAFSSRPGGSSAILNGAATANPTFVPDKGGTYTLSLVVSDGRASSQGATVTITAAIANAVPVANAGAAQTVGANVVAQLSGALSTDANGDSLTYQWAITTKPAGSTAMLSSYTAVNPLFLTENPGTYVVSLVVNDGKASSAPATVVITVTQGSPTGSRHVTVSWVAGDVYFSSASNLLLLTKFCFELVYFDDAILTMTGSTGTYDGKIKFSNGKTCDVNGAYLPSALRSGNYSATLTREVDDIYKDLVSGSLIWTQYCHQYVFYDNSTLQLTYGGGTAYASGAKVGTVVFASKSACNLVGIFGLAKLN